MNARHTRPLAWGQQYLMVDPDHFRIDYAINPFMHLDDQPDQVAAVAESAAIEAAIRSAGGSVVRMPQRPDSPDMVYAMNLGLVVDGRVVLSHMRYPQRRAETESATRWFADREMPTLTVGRDGVGAHLEAGDAFPWRGELVVGHGPRTEELALKHLATDLDVSVRGLRITHPAMYHLDLAFCPLDDDRALVCPEAFDEESAEQLLAVVPQPLVLSAEEAITTFCANSVVVGRTVVMPQCPTRVRTRLEAWGFEIMVVPTPEFAKGGGSIRCLTNPLDIRTGRDLEHVPGGRVV